MDSVRYHQIQTLFDQASELPRADRHAFLKAACGEDQRLIADVDAMLEEDERGGSFLDQPVGKIADDLLWKRAPRPQDFKEFGPYRIQRLLGEGGMGVVYLAERPDLGSLVAIKILRDAWLSPARRKRFVSEQRVLAQLTHPSIARLYDAGALPDGTSFFVMEYVEGVPLNTYCIQHSCSIRTRLELFRSVCEAVQYAHQQAIVHRDLKPSNILVKEDASIRLLDFGIAKQLEDLDSRADQTRTGLRLLTPAYASPEQVRGEPISVQSDVYSLGVILYELLADRLPFDMPPQRSAEAATTILATESAKPSAASTLAAGTTAWKDLDVLCMTAMHKDIQKRYASVEALIRDVDHYLKAEPLEARPDTFGYRFGKFIKRHRRAVAAAVVILTAGITMAAFFTIRLATARNAALAEAARTQRIQRFMMNLFQGGDSAAGPSDDLRVKTLIDRGVQEARALGNDPEVQAELYQTLGNLYRTLGNFDQADELLQSALKQRRSLFGSEHQSVAETLVALSGLRTDQDKTEEAEQVAREAISIARRTLPPGHAGIAAALSSLGNVLERAGRYDEAISVLDEAIKLQSTGNTDSQELGESLTTLANIHFYMGHYDNSDSLNRRILEMDRRMYGERHPNVATDLINLGAVQQEKGEYQEAERLYRQGLDITQAWFGRDHYKTASAMIMVVRAINRQGRLDEAAGMLGEVLAIQEKYYGKIHTRVAGVLNELGSVALQRHKLEEAETHFLRATEIYKEIHKDKHYTIGIALGNLASVYLEWGKLSQAEQLLREVLQRYGETLPADHQYVAVAKIKLGRTLTRQQRYTEAEGYSLGGYDLLKKVTNSSVSWLVAARTDLATIYDALNQLEKAARFRSELAGSKETP